MKTSQRENEILKNLLRFAHREKEKLEVGDHWQHNTMRTIRNLASFKSEDGFLNIFEQLVWRLSPGVCALIIIFFVILLNLDLVTDSELFQLLSYEPEDFNLMQIFML